MRTAAHHTCNKNGGIEYVNKNAPFLAEHKPKEKKYQFLGTGYYFWDDNYELAKSWGKYHCNDEYHIFKFNFILSSDTCFDLVGNRSHQQQFHKLFKIYQKYTSDNKANWSLSQCIEFLKKLRELRPNIFPYKMIRAIDLLNHTEYHQQFQLKFVSSKSNYTVINPKLVICVIAEQDVPSDTKKLVYTS